MTKAQINQMKVKKKMPSVRTNKLWLGNSKEKLNFESILKFIFYNLKIDTAVRFLKNPKVIPTPIENKRFFLAKKGILQQFLDFEF
jgi:hypothetical protein